jgi:hypothetical protein
MGFHHQYTDPVQTRIALGFLILLWAAASAVFYLAS